MENYTNITSQNISYNHSNTTSSSVNNDDDDIFVTDVVTCIIIGIGLPLTLLAIYSLYSQIRTDQVAPIYVINLLISDLIQLCCMVVWEVPTASDGIHYISRIIHFYTLIASICFMVCIALERYLVVVHPLWYRFRRTIKISVGVCVLVWVFPLVYVLISFFLQDKIHTFFGTIFLLPLPLFIFFLGGTLKVLSTTRVPSDEKRRIVGILVVVLLIYMLLFLPAIIFLLSKDGLFDYTFERLTITFLQFNPLADLILYIFMRKGTIDKVLSSVCCCRMDSDDTNSSVQFSSV